jgi:hypothetical protein
MARVITGKESISRWLRETLAALEQGEQEEGESQLSALMGDVQRLLKPIHNPARGSSVRAPGFAGDQVGLDHSDGPEDADLAEIPGRTPRATNHSGRSYPQEEVELRVCPRIN